MDKAEKNDITSVRIQLLVGEGLFIVPSSPSGKPKLIGSKCLGCGEVAFPKQSSCPNCGSRATQEVLLGPKGKLYSFTNVNNAVPGYKGPIPYGVGLVELEDGALVLSHLTESEPSRLKIGMEMNLVIDKLFEDDGNEIIGFKFKPV